MKLQPDALPQEAVMKFPRLNRWGLIEAIFRGFSIDRFPVVSPPE